jgi:hypothetical protein
VTECFRVSWRRIGQTVLMDRETYIAPIVESYIPDAVTDEKLALTGQFLDLFDKLANIKKSYRFDNANVEMIESESGHQASHIIKP